MTALDRLLVKAEMRCDRCDGEGDPPCGACALDHRLARIVRVLLEEARHVSPCQLALWSGGRPTGSGGYEECYAGKWYETRPNNKRPMCQCYLAEAEKIAGEP